MTRTLRGTVIVDGIAEGSALVTTENLAFSLVDPASGVVRQPGHPWNGQSVAGKVLFFPSGKGSSSGSYWLLNLAHEGKAPAAIVNTQTDAVIVAGAVLAGIPLVQRVDPDPLECIGTGDAIRVRGGGVIEIAARAGTVTTTASPERDESAERNESVTRDERSASSECAPSHMMLTPHQQAMLDGRHGWPQQLGMQLLTAVARAYDADALIPVASVHLSLSGVSVGAPGLRLFEQLVARGGQFVVPTTLNVLSADRRSVGRVPSLHGREQMQLAILDACKRMGALTTCSCNPFLLGFNPALGENVAWNESASAPYVNAVLGARTNREGATALASALTGYTAAYGMHIDANRRGSVLIDVEAEVQGSDAYAVLGGAVARACGARIPVIEGLAAQPTLDEFTAFCASFATVGPLANFHIIGVTPEAPTREAALKPDPDGAIETIRITSADLDAERARYSNAASDRIDVVAVGCPHASLAQIREVVSVVDARRVHADTLFVVQTSAAIAAKAEAEGLAQRLAAAGVELTADTCVHIAFREPPPGATLATNALKIAYLSASHDVAVRFGSLEQCVEAAIAGRWAR